MNRYWFEFEDGDFPNGIKLGCGVTAFNYDDALYLLNEKVFKGTKLPKIKNMVENIDLATLDAGHVLPNISPPNVRGIWFPMGYN